VCPAAALACGVALPAQAQTVPPAIAQFDDATISRLLLDGQATWRVEGGPDGRPVYRASVQDGLAFTVQPQACGPEAGCLGLVLIATFAPVEGLSLAALDDMLNRFNDANSSAKAYRTAQGVVLQQAYINAAFGISYANARAQTLVFGRNCTALQEALAALGEGR
jgi:hypothetical protein